MPCGGPTGGIPCGEAEEEPFDAAGPLNGLGFAIGLFAPTRTTRTTFAVGCGWLLWGALAVGGCPVEWGGVGWAETGVGCGLPLWGGFTVGGCGWFVRCGFAVGGRGLERLGAGRGT